MSITKDIQKRVAQIEREMNAVIKERADLVHGVWVARIAQLHLVILGPGGTAKNMVIDELVRHIDDAKLFKTQLNETKPPDHIFGPPNIKALAEDGRSRTVIAGMLPEATDAFLDEIFNANTPVLHSLHSIMNERVFHDGELEIPVPLRSLYAGTNKLTADADLAPFFDRLHLRYTVDYVKSRQSQMDMVTEAIARTARAGRRAVSPAESETRVTVDELDQAFNEALTLDMPQDVYEAFFDLRDALRAEGGIVFSDRRAVDGMFAVLANAWLRGHETVQIGDLDILAHMWWTLQEQAPKARSIVMQLANPTEKAALDLFDELDKLRDEFEAGKDKDEAIRRRLGVDVMRNAEKLLTEAHEHLAAAAGANTTRLTELIDRTEDFKNVVAKELFGLRPEATAALVTAGR